MAPLYEVAYEKTTTGVLALRKIAANSEFLFRANNANDDVEKSKLDNVHGCRHFQLEGVPCSTD
eukprot:4111326-Heterocapsa_arctica.AAC.1